MYKLDSKIIIFLILLSPFLIGAGIDRTASKDIHKSNKQLPINVGVVLFSDLRPDEEVSSNARKGACKFGTPSYFTSDGYSLEKRLTRPISYQIYKDLQIANIFKQVVFLKEYSTGEINENGVPDKLKTSIDAILIGNIKHFYGYSEAPQDGSYAYMGLMGYMMTESMKERVEYLYEGYTELTDIKLIDVSNPHILWEGDVEGAVKAERVITKEFLNKTQVASRSFHEAINKLVTELSKLEMQ